MRTYIELDQEKKDKKALIIVVLLCFLLGGIANFIGINNVATGLASKHWPTVVGQVESTRIYLTDDGDIENNYWFWVCSVNYSYELDGQTYHNNRYSLASALWSRSKKKLERKAQEQYPVGGNVTISYNPKDYNDSLLKPGASIRTGGIILGGISTWIWGVLFVIFKPTFYSYFLLYKRQKF